MESLLVAGVNVLRGCAADRRPGLLVLSAPPAGPAGQGLRTEHWPAIAVPTLILEGESDSFARVELLRAAMPLLPQGRLVTWPRLGHGLGPVLDEALDTVVAWLDDVGLA